MNEHITFSWRKGMFVLRMHAWVCFLLIFAYCNSSIQDLQLRAYPFAHRGEFFPYLAEDLHLILISVSWGDVQ